MPAALALGRTIFGGIWGALKGLPREVWYALAVIAALALLWRWHTGQVATAARDAAKAATVAENARWETEAARLRAIAAEEAQRRGAAVMRAETAEAQRRAALARTMAPIVEEIIRYERTPAGQVACLDDTGQLLANKAIAAANASIAAAAGRRN